MTPGPLEVVRTAQVDDFVTATVLALPPEPVLQMVCCGHPGPLLIRDGKVCDVAATRPSLPLGLGELNTVGYRVDTLEFGVGDSPSN